MSQLAAVVYCTAFGFVCSATIASFYTLVTAQRADFNIAESGAAKIAISVLITMFGGPFIVVQRVIAGLRSRELTAVPALFGTVVAGMWSLCAGIVYVSFLITA